MSNNNILLWAIMIVFTIFEIGLVTCGVALSIFHFGVDPSGYFFGAGVGLFFAGMFYLANS